jgi:hypothetical protein
MALFDDLVEIPGMRCGMRTSTLPKVMGMKCDEVDFSLMAFLLR